MKADQSTEDIERTAGELDRIIENMNMEEALRYFSEDCEIEFLEVKLSGKKGAEKWLDWLFENFSKIKFNTVSMTVEGDTLFKEYVLEGKLSGGKKVKSRQAEVAVFKDCELISLRLYFDRLDFAGMVAKGFAGKRIVREITKKTLKGLN